ncbi:MAG TPA: hypothetical protein DEP36_00900 [Gammaproteobacteria bacterium]|nr:hypothetical protein [Gammaproteobacteria bacterium]
MNPQRGFPAHVQIGKVSILPLTDCQRNHFLNEFQLDCTARNSTLLPNGNVFDIGRKTGPYTNIAKMCK